MFSRLILMERIPRNCAQPSLPMVDRIEGFREAKIDQVNYDFFVETFCDQFFCYEQRTGHLLSNLVYNMDTAVHFRKTTEWSVSNGYGVMVVNWHFQLFLTGGNEMPGRAGKILVCERESALGWRSGH